MFPRTTDVQDVAIDISAVLNFHRFSEHAIGVHGGMAHTLEQDGKDVDHVVSSVLETIRRHRRAESNWSGVTTPSVEAMRKSWPSTC